MDIRMASLPGCGLGGGGGGGGGSSGNGDGKNKGYYMKEDIRRPVGPQVTLISGQPPVLDTSGCKPSTSRTTSGLCGSTRKVGGNLWTSIRNMYNSIRSGPPLTWVNPGVIPEFHVPPAYGLETQYSMADALYVNQNQPLWYQATPGSQYGYQDPLEALSGPFSVPLPPYSSNMSPGSIYSFKKSSQPLNPEAKEWVPSGYKDNSDIKSSIPKCSKLSPDKNVQSKPTSRDVAGDFTEITENEIEEVRMKNHEEPKKIQETLTEKSGNKHVKNTVGSCCKSQKTNTFTETINSQEVGSVASVDEVLDPCAERQKIFDVSAETKCSAKHHQDSLSLSYASITRKSPEPLVNTKMNVAFEEKGISSTECVKQPLPKIFMKDKIYPKEKAPVVMENKKREPLPFKTVSKTQKKSSKKFLRDLKELSPVKSDCSFSGSEGSLESNSEIRTRFCMSSSPVILGLHGNEFTKEKTENSKSQRSLSESSTSSHVRTTSESTVGSVESIDIEFGEDCDIHENKHEENHGGADHCQSRSNVEGKYVNSIVAHILCFDNSECEDSDNDSDDSDWDTVQECSSHDFDDSWETFGFSIPLITKSSPCSESSSKDEPNSTENVCDNVCTSSSLKDINKKWEEEVCRDVTDSSPRKVSFGGCKVYPMVSWSFAYKNARHGPWEQYARDRARFNNRIQSLESIISPVLAKDHRNSMYCRIYGM